MKNPDFCDLVGVSTIGRARLSEIESRLAACNEVVQRHHAASGVKSRVCFFVSFMEARRGRGGCVVGSAHIPAADADAMMEAKELEPELLEGFSRMIQKSIGRFAARYGKDSSDLQAEAYEAFFGALINYTGESGFSTYLYWCLDRQLSRVCLDKGELKVPRDVRRMAMRVVDSMSRDRLTLDEAVSAAGIEGDRAKAVVAAMSRVYNTTELDMDESELARVEDSESLGWVMAAVERADLGFLERAVLKSFLDAPSDKMGLTKGCSGLVNPETGRPYSRTALSVAWKRAREKIAKAAERAA